MSWEDSFVKEFSFRKSVSWMPPGFRTITMLGLVSAAAESMAPAVQSATFSNEDSQLEANMRFTVDYVDKNHPDGWAVQDGTLAKLPECLSGNVDFYIAVKLEGQTSESGSDAFGTTVSPKFQIAFGNGTQGVAAHGQGVLVSGDSYKYSWSPAWSWVSRTAATSWTPRTTCSVRSRS